MSTTLLEEHVPLACPLCRRGTVVVHEATWPTPQGTGRSVWADEPLRCSRGCALTSLQTQRLLVDLYSHPVRQLAFPELEAAG